ncbi:MAG TPA: SRPBCC family protein [Luteimonas sp.]|nr:SRPBCC family protein [Luteimonas sp.]
MTRLIEILISFAIVAALMLLVGLVLPSSRHLRESVETNRKMTIVFDTLNSLRRFKDWNALVLRDPKAKLDLSGPASGVGAKLSWSSDNKQVGDGSWEIVESVPGKSVKYAIDDNRRGHDKTTEFILTPTGRGAVKRNVEITQTYDVKYGWNLLGRYAGLYVSRHVGDDLKLGLSRLTNMLATVPNVDYNVEGSKMRGMAEVQRPAEDLLVVKAGSIERNNEKIKGSMKSNMEWIKRTMDANGLVAAGPMRVISTELGRDNYTFDIAQPVKKAGSGDKAAADADKAKDEKTAKADEGAEKKDGELVFDVDTPTPVVAAGEPLDVKIPDGAPVQYVQTKPGHVAMAYYTGFMAELDNVRNALRAWALTQGYEVTDRPYEIYKNGIDKAFTSDGEYEVYWTLK